MRVDKRYWEIAFFTLILGYTAAMLLSLPQYRPDSQQVPQVIGITLVALILAKLSLLLLSDRIGLNFHGFFDDSSIEFDTEDEEPVDLVVTYRRELEMVGWTLFVLVLFWAVGFIVGTIVFIPVFVYAYKRRVWPVIPPLVVTMLIVYVLFVRLLRVNLWGGVLFG